MSKKCSITGKTVMSGNNVSHSNRKTRRRFLPNVRYISFRSELLNSDIRMKVCNNTIRTVDKNGGIDAYLLKTSSRKLTAEAAKVKRQLQKVAKAVN